MQRTAYCQLIRGTKKAKRLELAQRILESGNTFHNMIFSDECSISPPLFMFGGISRQGATKICIFDGIMGADLFCNVPETTLIPFITIIKVTSTSSNRIMTWSTRVGERKLSSTRKKSTGGVLPLMSPDLKPMETLWHELKFYLEWKVKPHNKQELVNCIKKFWERKVTPEKRVK